MKVVVNATPLIALGSLVRLDLLREMFDSIIVSAAVYEEVVSKGAGRPGAALVGQADWLQIVSPSAMLTTSYHHKHDIFPCTLEDPSRDDAIKLWAAALWVSFAFSNCHVGDMQ